MKKDKKAEFTRLPFEVDERIDDSLVTAHAGVPLVIELFRATGAGGVLDEAVKIKSRKRGLAASEMAESLFALWAFGGDRCEDLQQLREDAALAVLTLSSPTSSGRAMFRRAAGNIRILEKAFAALPAGVETVYVRSDSALYEHGVLRFLDGKKAGYGISSVMTPELRAAVERLAESEWKTITEETDAVRQWAEAAFCPNDGDHRKEGPVARRYLAIRIKKKQGILFADGSDRKHFAVVTNLEWAGDKILEWQRKKAGTVEHVHDVMKNGLAAGAFPSGKFGANAAWFRLNVICYNLTSLFKRETLPGEFWTAKPKKLRFALLNTVGKVIRHAGKTMLRLSTEVIRALFDGSRRKISLPASA